MKRALVVSAGVMLCAASVLADGRVRIHTSVSGWTGGNGGGAFRAEKLAPAAGQDGNIGLLGGPGPIGMTNSFMTFCVERNETISNNAVRYVEISKSSKSGGLGGKVPDPLGGTHDPLSSETALLYREFRNGGTFGGAVAGSWTAALSTALQLAIWKGEDELVDPNGQATNLTNTFNNNATAVAMWNWAVANANGSLYGVRVMRLWTNYDPITGAYSGFSQDMLTIIPLPSAGGLALAGLLVVGVRRRRSV